MPLSFLPMCWIEVVVKAKFGFHHALPAGWWQPRAGPATAPGRAGQLSEWLLRAHLLLLIDRFGFPRE